MWVNINELFGVDDEHFIMGVRTLTASGIEIRIESVGSRIPGEVTIYVQDYVVKVAKEIMTKAYDQDVEVKPTIELHEDSLEIGPAGNRFKVYGRVDAMDTFKDKIDMALAFQAYANKEFDEKQSQRKCAPKGKNHSCDESGLDRKSQ